ncbi:MAG TPA: MBL fold metallo-hydrolase [Kofleriaceae bacterium]|nr:MBL fold metallo-hydrolase [Kofleriaceae bacterium]
MKLTFLGAAREVTGSMLRIETATSAILIDGGSFQGPRAETRRRNTILPAAATGVDAVVLTHAHLDHAGNLPVLVRSGYPGPIYATAATRDLCAYMLRDAARIEAADADYLNRRHADDPAWTPIVPRYGEDDVAATLERFVCLPYGRATPIAAAVKATLIEAGHILGSAQVVLDLDERGRRARVVVSGDLGRKGLPILRDPAVPPRPIDVLVMESTYGNRRHAPVDEMADVLARVITETCARGGKLVVPAFALGRTQELLYALHQLRRDRRIPAIPIFVDSPLAIDVTSVFRLHPDSFDAATRRILDDGADLFGFEGVRVTRSREESIAINAVEGPALIIAGAGMAEGGRVLHHLRNLVEDARNTVLVVGFMAQHTLGRRLVERRPQVKIWGVERELRAQVVALNGFSAHADADDLLAYAISCAARRVFLVHGEPEAQAALGRVLGERGIAAEAPGRGDVVEV